MDDFLETVIISLIIIFLFLLVIATIFANGWANVECVKRGGQRMNINNSKVCVKSLPQLEIIDIYK